MKSFLLLLTIAYMCGCMEASVNDFAIMPLDVSISTLPASGFPLGALNSQSDVVNRGPVRRLADGIEICSQVSYKKIRNKCAEHIIGKLNLWGGLPNTYHIQNTTQSLSNKYMTGVLSLSNLTLSGLNNLRISNVRLRKTFTNNPSFHEMDLVVDFRGRNMRAQGNINGSLLFSGFELPPNGAFHLKSDEVKVRINVEVKRVFLWPPMTYLHFLRVHPQIRPANLYIYATGLDPDPTINAAILKILNKNWRTIYTEGLVKEFRKQWISYWTHVANRIAMRSILTPL